MGFSFPCPFELCLRVLPAVAVPAAPATISARSPTPVATGASAAVAAALLAVALLGFLQRPAFEHGLARETDLAGRVDAGHHNGDLVAHVDHVFHFVDAFAVELRNVHQTVHAG